MVYIKVKRVYAPAADDDGARILVGLWRPRGLSKTSLKLDAWLKEVGPGSQLRQWFGHESAKWAEFQNRYFHELNEHSDLIDEFLKRARAGKLTLLYAAQDGEHNNAVALKNYLEKRSR